MHEAMTTEARQMYVPQKVDAYWLEEQSFNGQMDLNTLVTQFLGRKYKGQQTDDFLPRGIVCYAMNTADHCRVWHDEEAIRSWLDKNPDDYDDELQLLREAPGIPCMLAHLILNGILPYGEYFINVDWVTSFQPQGTDI